MRPLLLVVGAVGLLVGTPLLYMRENLLDADRFGERAASTLDDETVRDEIARIVTAELELRVGTDLSGQRSVATAIDALANSPEFGEALEGGLAVSNRAVLERGRDDASLVLPNVGPLLRERLAGPAPELAGQIPDGLDLRIADTADSGLVVGVVQAARTLRHLAVIVVVFGAASLAAFVALARDRVAALVGVGVAIVLVAALLLVGYFLAREIVAAVPESDAGQTTARAAWDAIVGGLRDWALIGAVAGALVAASAAAGRSRVRASR